MHAPGVAFASKTFLPHGMLMRMLLIPNMIRASSSLQSTMRPQRLSYQAAGAVFAARAEPQPRAAMPSLPTAVARPAPRYGGTLSAPPRQRQLAVAMLLALHAAVVAALLYAGRLREVAVDAKPLFLAVVDTPARVAPARALPPPTRAQIPPLPLPPPPPTLPLVVAEAAPVPSTVPTLAPEPAAPAARVEAPPAPAPSQPRTIPPSAIQYIVPPTPVYPRVSARMRESGKAVVRVLIDEGGLPLTVQLATSTGFARLDDAALAAVRNCRFRPWLDNGVAVAAWANIPIEFELPT